MLRLSEDLNRSRTLSAVLDVRCPARHSGTLAHYEGGSEMDLGDKFSVSASGYYILPWGTQEIFVRGKKSSPGSTKSGASLTRDDGE
jgi:hypothetical protein